jgi:gamma-glutamylcyclotransferase (GGCT)/AIG2-like uncharacterized protein YtfP
MDPAIWSRVSQQVCESRPAVLRGYESRSLRGVTFPGLVECAGRNAPGLLYYNISPAAIQRLDEYEDDFYERIEVTVELEDGTLERAQVYLVDSKHQDIVLPDRWTP